jgi:hypothetical protein
MTVIQLPDALARHTFTWFGGHDTRDTGLILRVPDGSITGTSSSHLYSGTTELGGDRHATMLEDARTTLKTLTFFAWAFVALAAVAVSLAAWNFGDVFTVANLWFLGAAVNLAATGIYGRRPANTVRSARVRRHVMVIGLAVGLTAFTVAVGLLATQVVMELLF